MITVSNEYRNQLNNLSLSPKSKIVVNGVEYLGNVLKTFPKIKHQSSILIGCFPTKTIDFEIHNFNNDIDFINKEIEVYLGLYFDNKIEWVKQGIFIPQEENVETNITTRTINFKGVQDKTQFLNAKYETSLNWGIKHTGLEIVKDICTRLNLELANTIFPFSNYQFSQPNFKENITYRGVIAQLAEIGGAIAFFNNDGKLEIKKQTETNYVVERSRYSKISEEKSKTINTVVLGKDGIKDDIVYPVDLTENREEYKILDNGFVDLIRREIIGEVANNIIGFNYQPITLENFTDGFIFELNDVIKVKDRNNNEVRLVILDIERTSRIKSTIKCISQEETKTDYKIAGSIKDKVKVTELKIDHVNQKIESLVEKEEENSKKITKITQNLDGLTLQVSNTTKLEKEVEGGYDITIDKALERDAIEFVIKEDIEIFNNFYPSDFIFPSDDTFPRGNC